MNCKKIAVAVSAFLLAFTFNVADASAQAIKTHTIQKGQTLYSIARQYHASVKELEELNPGLTNNIAAGQTIKVPAGTAQATASKKVHVVKSAETLYSISRQYNVSANQLIQYNNLKSTALTAGQALKIPSDGADAVKVASEIAKANSKKHKVQRGETLYAIAQKYQVSVANIKSWNAMKGNSLDVGQELIVGLGKAEASPVVVAEVNVPAKKETASPTKTLPATAAKSDKPVKEIPYSREEIQDGSEFKKVVERGMSGIMTGSEDTKKYLALHPTAPVGTIMQVRNDMNNRSVFVRVIGKLPPTGDNKKLVISLSKTAYERLGAFDQRFPVEVTYVP
ncbi:LysM peptidoglycan-binding domain-containing protein [Persicobacter psychrovividus]|uniref:LysM domain-containing protein n=1 Tax=Persicobacter psychrovividus TaxID=387638 RepID=A0ABM7VBW1_9BACT|nr:hypothetical protein PEPS_06560 [Persicobacter psychrovividus]